MKVNLAFKKEEIYLQAIAISFYWLSYIYYALKADYPLLVALWTQTPYLLLDLFFCYTTYLWICPSVHKHFIILIFKHIFLFLFFFGLYWGTDQIIPEYENGEYVYHPFPLSDYASYTLHYLVTCSIIAYGLYYYKYGIQQVNNANEEKIRIAQIGEMLAKKELDYYKGEFNSHFTFNILTYFQSKTINNPEIFDPLLIFTDILRYNTKLDSNKPVKLSYEIEYINNFIELNNLIHPNLHIDFKLQGASDDFIIYPRIIMGFLENAIKHGNATDPEHPIKIILKVEEGKMYLTVKNKKRSVPVRNSTKKGLVISKTILDKLYHDQHNLTIENENETFTVKLILVTTTYSPIHTSRLYEMYS